MSNLATTDEREKYLNRACAYACAASVLEKCDALGDRQVRATLDQMAIELRELGKRWRTEMQGGL